MFIETIEAWIAIIWPIIWSDGNVNGCCRMNDIYFHDISSLIFTVFSVNLH